MDRAVFALRLQSLLPLNLQSCGFDLDAEPGGSYGFVKGAKTGKFATTVVLVVLFALITELSTVVTSSDLYLS